MNTTKIAINGFGRIGRSFFRATYETENFDIVAINDLTDTKTLAYLLKYDSVYGRYSKNVSFATDSLLIDGKSVRVFAEKDPANLPWRDLDIDVVVESTGFFTDGTKAKAHLTSGAKKVVITAPAKGDVVTALVGVNDDRFTKDAIITCNASCTTNSVAPVMAILLENFGIEKSSMVTVHGYTATQKLVDGPDSKDVRKGRAAATNIVPSTTGAAEAVIQSIPVLEGKFGASSIRVPVISGSLSVITVLLNKLTTAEEINKIFENAAQNSRWSKSLKVTNDEIVSTDIIGEPYGAIVDLTLTRVIGENFVQMYSWYDNEAGYTATLVEHVRRVGGFLH
ncbi:MAG: type I glyceraldehyde-3-phosphate dehydrogenase [Patescibacteria group bacterium]